MRDLRNMASSEERTTVVTTSKLLETLRTNRASHLEEYKLAVEGYLVEARARLETQHELAKQELQKAYDRAQDELKRYDPAKASDTIVFCKAISFTLVAPRNYVDAYDQSIEMLEWETRETVELNTTEFRCFVMNKWDWMEEFKNVSMRYSTAS